MVYRVKGKPLENPNLRILQEGMLVSVTFRNTELPKSMVGRGGESGLTRLNVFYLCSDKEVKHLLISFPNASCKDVRLSLWNG